MTATERSYATSEYKIGTQMRKDSRPSGIEDAQEYGMGVESTQTNGMIESTGGKILLTINSKTPKKLIRNSLFFATNCNAGISIIYEGEPSSRLDEKTPGEYDSEFAFTLDQGKKMLEAIAQEAARCGVRTTTSFVWHNKSRLKQSQTTPDRGRLLLEYIVA